MGVDWAPKIGFDFCGFLMESHPPSQANDKWRRHVIRGVMI
jgi:hypothetical protein